MTVDTTFNSAFYQLWFDDSNPDAAIARQWDLRGVDPWIVLHGTPIYEWPADITFLADGQRAEDRLGCALTGWELVSDRVRRSLVNCTVHGVQFLPVSVLWLHNRESVGQYWLLNITRQVAALDWDRSRWLIPEAPEKALHPILNVVQVVLQRSEIRDTDFFRLIVNEPTTRVYVSHKVVTCLHEASASSGFKFLPTKSY